METSIVVTGEPAPFQHAEPFNRLYVYLISSIAAVGGFLLTYDIIIMSGAILFLKKQFHLSPAQEGFAMTSAIVACFFSPSLGGWFADHFGRKRTLIAAAAIFALSAVGTAIPHNIWEFNLFRNSRRIRSGSGLHRLPHVHCRNCTRSDTGQARVGQSVFQRGRCADRLCGDLCAFVFRQLALDVRVNGNTCDHFFDGLGFRSGKSAMARAKGACG